jgi:hypothetical protein
MTTFALKVDERGETGVKEASKRLVNIPDEVSSSHWL